MAQQRRDALRQTSSAFLAVATANARIEKSTMKSAFFARRQFAAILSNAMIPRVSCRVRTAHRGMREGHRHAVKKIARKCPRNGVDKTKSIKNERIGCK
jgi:hypothetical protein